MIRPEDRAIVAPREPQEPILGNVVEPEEPLNVGMGDLKLPPTFEKVHFSLQIRKREILMHREILTRRNESTRNRPKHCVWSIAF